MKEGILRAAVQSVGNKQVEIAVVVVISPHAGHRDGSVERKDRARNFGERAVAVISIQMVATAVNIRDKEVRIPIVVVITPVAAKTKKTVSSDAAVSHLVERAVAIVLEK